MIDQRGEALAHGLVEVGLDAVAVAVDDPVLEAPLDGPARAVLAGRHGEADTPSNRASSSVSGS